MKKLHEVDHGQYQDPTKKNSSLGCIISTSGNHPKTFAHFRGKNSTPGPQRSFKVFLCYIISVCRANADRDLVSQGDDMRKLPAGTCLNKNGMDRINEKSL